MCADMNMVTGTNERDAGGSGRQSADGEGIYAPLITQTYSRNTKSKEITDSRCHVCATGSEYSDDPLFHDVSVMVSFTMTSLG